MLGNVNWRGEWQTELQGLLVWYLRYRSSHPAFFLQLLVFFFIVNAICYWAATIIAFPEVLETQPGRIAMIQQPVALLGGLFDSLSFFITVELIRRASVAPSSARFFAVLSVDLLIAAVATAWVLLVVMLSSWLIGPPELAEFEAQQQAIGLNELVSEPQQNTTMRGDALTTERATIVSEAPDTGQYAADPEPVPAERLADVNVNSEYSTDFYRDLVIRALSNPLDNLRYFLFGIIMGLSTLLPSLFHLFMGIRSLLARY